MTSPILALRRAVHARLSGDAALAAMLGGPRIHEEPPRAAEGLYIVFGDQRLTDRSTASDRGHEQEVTLVIWAKGLGARAALEAAERIRVLLDDAALTLAGHRLVLLAVTRCELKRDERARAARVALTLRAVTEEL